MELRVLSGPQAGCRLPLGAGTYRAGADETCDVVLEGWSGNETAFVVYVGQRSIGLESLSDELRLEGRAVSGLVALIAGQVFELGPWLFAVDDPQAPWPQNPESLRAAARDAHAGTGAHDGDEGMSPADILDAADAAAAAKGGRGAAVQGDQRGSGDARASGGGKASAEDASGRDGNTKRGDADNGDGNAGPSDGDALTSLSADADAARFSTPRRRKVPFWVIGLAGTAAFLVCGVMVLVMSLAPAQPASAAAAPHPSADALAKLVAATNGDVKLEHAGDRSKLVGVVSTRATKLKLTRDARAIEPTVLLQITADEDLDTLARDAMSSFPQSGIELSKIDHGRLILTGRVSEAKARDQIVAALEDSVPGLAAVDSHVLAGDEVLASYNSLMNEAGLTKRITGTLDQGDPSRLVVRGVLPEADRTAWADVRQKLETHFGTSLNIIEDLHAPDAVPPSVAPTTDDVVAIVRGPMPYALMRDGTKRALPASAK